MNPDDRVDTELDLLRRSIIGAAALLSFSIICAAMGFGLAINQAAKQINDRLASWEVIESRDCPTGPFPTCTPVADKETE